MPKPTPKSSRSGGTGSKGDKTQGITKSIRRAHMINPQRIFTYNQNNAQKGPVVYWMSRDQRVDDNWALIHAIETARENNADMAVVFCLSANYPGANLRHFDFMLGGLSCVEKELKSINIPFFLLKGNPTHTLPLFLKEYGIGLLITDFDPLRVKMQWKKKISEIIEIPFHEVDAHNIVPCRKASNKLEFGAYTIRPKINRLLEVFMDNFPEIRPLKNQGTFLPPTIHWEEELRILDTDRGVAPIKWIMPGEKAAGKVLENFIETRLPLYHEKRNDPNEEVVSNLSPYFHFGHLSPQRVAIRMVRLPHDNNTMGFLDEMIVRRELSDNFCLYNSEYDSFAGFPNWAKKTLDEHRGDAREVIYTRDEFEKAETHDPLWNAAQTEMVVKGKMHGYMRMYWAKKILEWTPSPEEALRISIHLNDKYELDGRDPNGYTGCAWSVGGVHDRAWSERPVFGKIRYMNYNGCKRKFDVKHYIKSSGLL